MQATKEDVVKRIQKSYLNTELAEHRNQPDTEVKQLLDDSSSDESALHQKNKIGYFGILFWGLLNAFPQVDRSLITATAFIIMDITNQQAEKAHFGLYNMVRGIMMYSIFRGFQRHLIIKTSQTLAKDPTSPLVKRYFIQTIILFLLHCALIYLPFVFGIEQIFKRSGITDDITRGFRIMTLKNLPNDVLEGIRVFIMGFCNCQKIEKSFAVISWSCMIPLLTGLILLAKYSNYGIDAWIIGRTIYQIATLIGCLIVYFKYTKEETQGVPPLGELFREFLDYCGECYSFWVVSIFAFLSWEVGTFLIALSNDENQISAYGSMVNVMTFVFDIQSGFLIVLTTHMNFLLGSGHPRSAKKFAFKVFVSQIIVAGAIGVFFLIFCGPIAEVYAKNNQIQLGYLYRMFYLYAIFVQIDMSGPFSGVTGRNLGLSWFVTLTYAAIMVVANAIIGSLLKAYWNADCVVILIAQYVCFALAYGAVIARIFVLDWKTVKLYSK